MLGAPRHRNSGKQTRPWPPLFVPVQVADVGQLTGGVQIELPGGAVVTLPSDASAELVTAASLKFLRERGQQYIVGTPKLLLRQFEQQLTKQDWTTAQEGWK